MSRPTVDSKYFAIWSEAERDGALEIEATMDRCAELYDRIAAMLPEEGKALLNTFDAEKNGTLPLTQAITIARLKRYRPDLADLLDFCGTEGDELRDCFW
jgi:hypothetical protein